MKKVNEFDKDLSNKITKLEQKLMEAQAETAKKMKEDIIKKLGFSSGRYVESIQTSKTEKSGDIIKTSIYTDLKSKDGYFIGRMIENGTGIYALEPHIGHTKTFMATNYQYWYVPALEVDRPIGKVVLIEGLEYYVAKAQKPKPHWKPVAEEDYELYKENVKKAFEEVL